MNILKKRDWKLTEKPLYDNIIFDLDGTLVDSFQDIYAALTAAADALDLPAPSRMMLESRMFMRLDELVESIYPEEDKTAVMEEFRNFYDNSGYPASRLYPGVKTIMAGFHKNGYGIFVATNKRNAAAKSILSNLELSDCIDDIYASDCVSPPLMKSDLVKKIIENKKLDPRKTIMIGDTMGDLQAAVQNEVDFIFAAYGYGQLDRDALPGSKIKIAESFSQIKNYIR
jgi:phosphoglycolate phosphatase